MATATVAPAAPERYSIYEAALLMDCSPDKVRQMVKAGTLASHQDPDDGWGKYWISAETIAEFNARNRVRASMDRQVAGMLRRGKI